MPTLTYSATTVGQNSLSPQAVFTAFIALVFIIIALFVVVIVLFIYRRKNARKHNTEPSIQHKAGPTYEYDDGATPTLNSTENEYNEINNYENVESEPKATGGPGNQDINTVNAGIVNERRMRLGPTGKAQNN